MSRATVAQCVILRPDLRPYGDRPLLHWLLREFIRYGVTEFLLPAGSLADQRRIEDIQAKLPRPVRIIQLPRKPGMSTQAMARLQDRFMVCGGTALPEAGLGSLLAKAASDQGAAAGWTFANGVCVIDKKRVDRTAPDPPRPVWPLKAAIRQVLKEQAASHGPGLHGPGLHGPGLHGPGLHGLGSHGLGTVADIRSRLCRRALFLDRDGVLNIDHGYVGSRDRFEWTDGALDAIRFATEAGWHVFIVTNQSGVARGLYSEDAVRDLLDWIADEARAAGGTIDDTRFCPFHPDALLDAYRQAHPWRKPLPGMLLDLIARWELDASRAVMIGDQETDMRAAAAAGIAGHLFDGGNLLSFLRPLLARQA